MNSLAPPNSTSPSSQPSPFVIFLDIDGVLYNQAGQMAHRFILDAKVQELFPNGSLPKDYLSIAAVHFFNAKAIKNLTYLINTINKTRDVQIVMSSAWREKRSAKQLQTFFGIHEFSKYIVDKTVDILSREEEASCRMCKKHQSDTVDVVSDCRAAQIQLWLNQHPQITSYAVIDDYDDHLRELFKGKFYQTNFSDLLTKQICKKILTDNHLFPLLQPINLPKPCTKIVDSLPALKPAPVSLPLSPFVIFLPIKGVLYEWINHGELEEQIRRHQCFINQPFPGEISLSVKTREAIKNINNLINTIEKMRAVQLVLLSSTRVKMSVDFLQKIFSNHYFSKYIFDDAPNIPTDEEVKSYCPNCVKRETYCRAAQIAFWLEHHPVTITSYAVIDSGPFWAKPKEDQVSYDHLKNSFKNRFYETKFTHLLTKEICEKILADTIQIPQDIGSTHQSTTDIY